MRMTVPLATSDLPVGRQIVLGDIGLHSMTQEEMAQRGLADTAVMLSPEQIIGRVVSEPIKRDGPFMTTSVYLEGGRAPLSEVLEPGYRAVSLQIPELRGGMTTPGTFVDVVFRSEAQTGRADQRVWIPEVTVTLIESVEVIAVERAPTRASRAGGNLDVRYINGRRMGPPPLPTITLAVTLTEANVLRTVDGRGELTLMPRSAAEFEENSNPRSQPHEIPEIAPPALDRSPQHRPAMTLEGLLGVQAPPEPFMTEVYRRGSRSVQLFDSDGLIEVEKARPTPGAVTSDLR